MNTKLLELVNLLLKTDKKVYLVLCKALNMGLRQFFCKKNWQAIQTASGSTKFYKKFISNWIQLLHLLYKEHLNNN